MKNIAIGLVAFLLVMLKTVPAHSAAENEADIKVNVRGYQELDLDHEIIKQEQLFKNIVVELEFTLDEEKSASSEPLVSVVPARSIDKNPRF